MGRRLPLALPLRKWSLLTLLLCAFSTTAFASPVRVLKLDDCDRRIHESTLPSYNWSGLEALNLAQQCLQSSTPENNSCVFYTSGYRDNAILFAAANDKQTIYDVYQPHWFNTSLFPASKWVENGMLRKVFRVTSRAYAISCSGSATLVMAQNEVPCAGSIWLTDEFDVIRRHISNITELFQASLIGKAGGVWQWIVKKMSIGAEGDVVDGKKELRKRYLEEIWDFHFDIHTNFELEESGIWRKKFMDSPEFDLIANEWAIFSGGECKQRGG